MKRTAPVLLAVALLAAFFAGCAAPAQDGADDGRLSVYASFYPMADFARKVGGDLVRVTTVVPDGTEPHHWEPAAADIADLEQADVFVYNGLGMEHWVDTVLSAVQGSDLVVVEAAHEVPLLQEHEGEEEAGDGHDHGEGDPHVWLNPRNAILQMAAIRDVFIQADPDHADRYNANYDRWAAEFTALDREFADAIAALPGRDIVVAHQAYGYLCDAYGLHQVAIEGLTADSEPDAARMAQIIDFAREKQIRVIFFEEMASPKVAQTIADAIGASTAVLSPLEGLTDAQREAGDDYLSVMRQNLSALKTALE
jgi:zinc transport system substrate-binding protein